MFNLIINGTTIEDKYVYIANRPLIPSPEREATFYENLGRDGSLVELECYKDIEFSVDFHLINEEGIKQKLRDFKRYFTDVQTVGFTDDREYYYKVKHVKVDYTENKYVKHAHFTVHFRCDPFQYLIMNKITTVDGGRLVNHGSIYSLPIITLFGDGDMDLKINGKLIKLKSVSGQITLNSGLKEAYRLDVSANHQMTGSFPIFEVGDNLIEFSENVKKIEIEPGWRFL